MSDLVHSPIFAWAQRHPERVALRTADRADINYAELVAIASQYARELPSGTRVAISPRSDAQSIAAVLGTWMAGSSVVLMHRHLKVAQATEVVTRSAAAVVIDDRMRLLPGVSDPAQIAAGEMLVALTSGTSGSPKPFARGHRSWIATFERSDHLVMLGADDVVAVPGAIDHTHFLYGALHALNRGATVDLRIVSNTDWQQTTVLYSVPTIAADLTAHGEHLDRVHTVLSSGAAWQPTARQNFQRLLRDEARVYDFYGAGELSFISVNDGNGPAGSVGRPFPGVQVSILRSDRTLADPGEPGTIHVDSDMLFDGYLHDDMTASRPSRPVTVGDHGHIDDRGWLHLTGRQSRMFTRGALNVEPEAIEATLTLQRGVTSAACVARPDSRWGHVPVAFVILADAISTDDLHAWCAERLDVVHRPVSIHVLDRMPTTHRAKTDYRALQELLI